MVFLFSHEWNNSKSTRCTFRTSKNVAPLHLGLLKMDSPFLRNIPNRALFLKLQLVGLENIPNRELILKLHLVTIEG